MHKSCWLLMLFIQKNSSPFLFGFAGFVEYFFFWKIVYTTLCIFSFINLLNFQLNSKHISCCNTLNILIVVVVTFLYSSHKKKTKKKRNTFLYTNTTHNFLPLKRVTRTKIVFNLMHFSALHGDRDITA